MTFKYATGSTEMKVTDEKMENNFINYVSPVILHYII